MRIRWPIALAMVAILASAVPLSAQRRGPVGTGTGRPASPGPRSSQPTVGPPFRPIGPFAPFRGARPPRPMSVRSSLFGLFFYSPYWWFDPAGFEIFPPPMDTSGATLTGGLQLDVEPRRALVYVDGVLAGTVDDFKGYFQHLETSAGFHVISFLTPDYDPLTIGVMVVPSKTITYRGSMNRR
jgi:hypothetical protein